ncbi:MAG TPA: oligopeptide/dipeptide ABC transporter ATP-binding protein [Candidatus Limnocylindrales bacterium]|nr:oligopeptide/dipeptide ABC transporter ATP-binding protein [Candidatus Limnocylindrales bacterium]
MTGPMGVPRGPSNGRTAIAIGETTAIPVPILDVDALEVHFRITRGVVVQRRVGAVRAVDGVSFTIRPGEVLGLVGESGSGKTTTGRAIVGLVKPTGGTIRFEGHDIEAAAPAEQRALRRRIQIVFQDPYSSLNPRMTIGNIVADPLRVHAIGSEKTRRERVAESLRLVGLDPSIVNRYPHQFSGGQRQRIGVARALSVSPALVVCDEPVSALDVSIQAQILNLLADLRSTLGLSYLFIGHDLAVVRHIADRVAVMYLGRLMELADRDAIYRRPLHPYTRALLGSVHVPDPAIERRRQVVPLVGDIPSPSAPPPGCRFSSRCPLRASLGDPERCATEEPTLRDLGRGHLVACHFADPSEPSIPAPVALDGAEATSTPVQHEAP